MKRIAVSRPVVAIVASGVAVLVALIAGCGGGGGSPGAYSGGSPPVNSGGNPGSTPSTPPPITFVGSAATGAGIVNAPVVIKCSGSIQAESTTSDTAQYRATMLAAAKLPCVLRVIGPLGPLHAAVGTNFTGGEVNITPLTDLQLSLATGETASTFFNGFSDGQAAKVTPEKLAAAQREVINFVRPVVNIASVSSLVSDPLVAAVAGKQGGNLADQQLDQLAAAMAAYNKSLSQLTTALLAEATGDAASLKVWPPGASPQGPVGTTPVTSPQTINFSDPGAQVLSTTSIPLTATATSGLPVSFSSLTPNVCTVNGATLALQGVGTCSVSAMQGGSQTVAAAVTITRSFIVSQASTPSGLLSAQTITFVAPAEHNPNERTPALSATATSGLRVTFTSNTPSICNVTSNTFSVQAITGKCEITASQSGDGTWAAAEPVKRTIVIRTPGSATRSDQVITFNPPTSLTLSPTPVALLATSSSGLPVAISGSTPTVCTVANGALTLVAEGACLVTASQSGSASYLPATSVTKSIEVGAVKTAQTITFAALTNQTLGTTAPALTATASSGLPVTFSSATPGTCSTTGSTLNLLAAGGCSITATQSGNSMFAIATPVTRSFTIAAAVGTAAVQLSATSIAFGAQTTGVQSAAQSITLTNSGTGNLVLGSVAINGVNAVEFQTAGTSTCTPARILTAGANCTYSATFFPASAGPKAASVSITHSGTGSTASIGLTGSAQAPSQSSLQTLIDQALALANAAIKIVKDFVAATYPAITFNQATSPRVIQPSSVAAAPVSTISISNSKNWTDTTLWGGSLPTAGAAVVIPAGTTVFLDTTTPSLGDVTINGTLKFANQDAAITAKSITINSTGALQIGEPGNPFIYQATITLTGAKGSASNTRGITVNGGKLEMYGALPSPVWTQLNDHANANTKTFILKDPVNWKAGDTIAVGPSDFYGVNPTERLTVATTASGNTMSTNEALAKFRWGKLQYMTDAGISLTPGAYTPPVTPAPTQLDQRAAVGNLTRKIVIQGANDADWTNNGFGAHVMIMNLSSKVFVDGVEFRRVGQAGQIARYPFHWHLLSYDVANGTFLGNATGHEFRNNSIWQSAQRCVVVHGTNGVKVTNNICQDIKGHAFFLEDGVERKNVFEGNLALMIRNPKPADLLLQHEGTNIQQAGPAGFWITNPDNIIRNNVVGDAVGNAYWNSFPTSGVGLSRKVVNPDLAGTQWAGMQMAPRNMPHGVFDNNVGYSTGRAGMNTDQMLLGGGPVGDDLGNAGPENYRPTLDGRPYDINGKYVPGDPSFNCNVWPIPSVCRSTNMRATFSRVTLYKTNLGYRNRVGAPDYPEWVMADIAGAYAAGAGNDGAFMRGLFIGQSLNNPVAFPAGYGEGPPAMFATYHSTFQMRDSVMAHIGYVEDPTQIDRTSSGVFKSDDYYISQMERGSVLNANNRLINAFAGARSNTANLYTDAYQAELRASGRPENYSLSGAIWDPHGYWGNKGFYWTFDVPFLTSGGGCTPSLFPTATGKNSLGQYNGQSCAGEFYGMTHQEYTDFLRPANSAGWNNYLLWPIDVERLDCNPASFTSVSLGKASRACRWIVGPGYDSWVRGNFRGATLRNGGEYKVMYPTPEDRTYPSGSFGRPNFTDPAVTTRKTGTMVNAEGQTVPISIPKVVNIQFTNVARATDSFVMAISFDGTKTPTALLARTDNAYRYRWLLQPNPQPNKLGASDIPKTRVLTIAANLAEVKSDMHGSKMWQDRENNLVWIKVVGSLPASDPWYRIENFTAPFGQDIYQEISLFMKDNTIPNQ